MTPQIFFFVPFAVLPFYRGQAMLDNAMVKYKWEIRYVLVTWIVRLFFVPSPIFKLFHRSIFQRSLSFLFLRTIIATFRLACAHKMCWTATVKLSLEILVRCCAAHQRWWLPFTFLAGYNIWQKLFFIGSPLNSEPPVHWLNHEFFQKIIANSHPVLVCVH